ncbi:hypothetical protein [Paenibacillus sp. YPG26]|uniref:hypothetical protein n=1 Tax=Paenibacillus sp. YPG26 TaxID=2878915 RepID=UPI00203E002F|nr:hypothetical protein [Paenibacillus sp. YPG26]USB33776.1 hypothetical protein LDO05_02830 [Paenibacillus sp. YPG26]
MKVSFRKRAGEAEAKVWIRAGEAGVEVEVKVEVWLDQGRKLLVDRRLEGVIDVANYSLAGALGNSV